MVKVVNIIPIIIVSRKKVKKLKKLLNKTNLVKVVLERIQKFLQDTQNISIEKKLKERDFIETIEINLLEFKLRVEVGVGQALREILDEKLKKKEFQNIHLGPIITIDEQELLQITVADKWQTKRNSKFLSNKLDRIYLRGRLLKTSPLIWSFFYIKKFYF